MMASWKQATDFVSEFNTIDIDGEDAFGFAFTAARTAFQSFHAARSTIVDRRLPVGVK